MCEFVGQHILNTNQFPRKHCIIVPKSIMEGTQEREGRTEHWGPLRGFDWPGEGGKEGRVATCLARPGWQCRPCIDHQLSLLAWCPSVQVFPRHAQTPDTMYRLRAVKQCADISYGTTLQHVPSLLHNPTHCALPMTLKLIARRKNRSVEYLI